MYNGQNILLEIEVLTMTDRNNLIQAARQVIEQVSTAVLGKNEEIREVMLTLLAGGSTLIEDIPGVGKTTLATGFARSMSLDYKRVQFTPDLMPSDLTGFSVYDPSVSDFIFKPGASFCNLLLADEINRSSPKTQSALLEVMEEKKVSVDGNTRDVPDPFFVIATQNPLGSIGTQRLPEAQTDRFMTSLKLGYPDRESEILIAKGASAESRTAHLSPVISADELRIMQKDIYDIYIKDELYGFICDLISATRSHPLIQRGASPRASIALTKLSKASAWINGRDFCIPEDIYGQFMYAVPHRLILNNEAKLSDVSAEAVCRDICESVPAPEL